MWCDCTSPLFHLCHHHLEQLALAEKLRLTEERERLHQTQTSEDLQLEVSDLKTQLDQREQALKQAHLDVGTLTAELEELDRQNQEATQVCL